MLMKQVDHNGGGNNVRYGDSFTEDQFAGETFDYFLTNPPFGVDWKKQQKEIQEEHDKRGFDGRFGAGLPRMNDGSLLFLQHMWDKREPVRPAQHKHGSRLAIVFSGSDSMKSADPMDARWWMRRWTQMRFAWHTVDAAILVWSSSARQSLWLKCRQIGRHGGSEKEDG